MITFDENRENRRLSELQGMEAEHFAEELAKQYGLQYTDLTRVAIQTDALRLIPEANARAGNMAGFALVGSHLKIAVLSPAPDLVVNTVAELTKQGFLPELFIVSPGSLAHAWERYAEVSQALASKAGQIDVSSEQVAAFISKSKTLEDVKNLMAELGRNATASGILEVTLAGAMGLGASDIHIEPEEVTVRIRYRLDGVLTETAVLRPEIYKMLNSRVKLISGLKLNVRTTRQDGRFSIKVGDVSIEVRTSVIPGAYGENIVLRLLDPRSIDVPLESLGMSDNLMKIVEEEIAKPNGMILNTGPTGSGKTTTLYAFLKRINNPEIKIITIEDPIEYHLSGVTQTQTDAKRDYTFAEGLKSALRQDPDVIMVGEIRDEDTAKTAVDAALTGHLVFSTLHTNNASGAIPRLIGLDVNPTVMGPSINLIMAQRLVRKLCQLCRKETTPDEKTAQKIATVVERIVSREFKVPDTRNVYEPVGCEKCHKGYKGRVGIFEALKIDKNVEGILGSNPSEYDVAKAAEPQKILWMAEDGILKILEGVTSIDELERVVSIE